MLNCKGRAIAPSGHPLGSAGEAQTAKRKGDRSRSIRLKMTARSSSALPPNHTPSPPRKAQFVQRSIHNKNKHTTSSFEQDIRSIIAVTAKQSASAPEHSFRDGTSRRSCGAEIYNVVCSRLDEASDGRHSAHHLAMHDPLSTLRFIPAVQWTTESSDSGETSAIYYKSSSHVRPESLRRPMFLASSDFIDVFFALRMLMNLDPQSSSYTEWCRVVR